MGKKISRVIALIGVVLIVIMIIATLIVAVINKPGTQRLFTGLLVCDFVVPVVLWIYMNLYKIATRADDKINKKVEELVNSDLSDEELGANANKENVNSEDIK